MKKRLTTLLAIGTIVALLGVGVALTQTTGVTLITPAAQGTSPGVPFNCDTPQSQKQPFTFYQFECRGVPFNDENGNPDGKLFWFTVLSFYGTFNDVVQPVQGFGTTKYRLDYYTNPANGNPGTFGVEFQFIDAVGLFHYGVWSGTFHLAGNNRGQLHPVLETSRIDNYDQSTVAILDLILLHLKSVLGLA